MIAKSYYLTNFLPELVRYKMTPKNIFPMLMKNLLSNYRITKLIFREQSLWEIVC
jgi:hypothetical protein